MSKMTMYEYNTKSQKVNRLEVDDFINRFYNNDRKAGIKKWNFLKKGLNNECKKYKDAVYKTVTYKDTANNDIKIFYGINLSKEHIQTIQVKNNEQDEKKIYSNTVKLDNDYVRKVEAYLLEEFDGVRISDIDYIYDDKIEAHKNTIKVKINNYTSAKNFNIYQKNLGEFIKKKIETFNDSIELKTKDVWVESLEGSIADKIMKAEIIINIIFD